jgi:hypothetical protein
VDNMRRSRLSALLTTLVPASVLLANIITLLVQLLIPHFLSPVEYTGFATAWAVGQFSAIFGFEWLRYGVIRFSFGADKTLMEQRRSALLLLYIVVVVFFLVASLICAFAGMLGYAAFNLASSVLLYGVCQGVFDGRQALARAENDHSRFVGAWLLRAIFSVSITVTLARVFGTATAALWGLSLSYLAALGIANFRDVAPAIARFSPHERAQLPFLLHYGIFAATAATMTSFLPAAIRMLTTQIIPDTAAGGMLLALDLSQKAILALGLAVNIVLVQRSIRFAEFESSERQDEQNALQISVPFALLVPAAMGFYLVQPAFEALVVPAGYLLAYRESIGLACVSAGLMAFRSNGIDPLFVVAGRPLLSIIAPSVAFIVSFIYILAKGKLGGFSANLIPEGTALGLVAGVIASAVAINYVRKLKWPLADLGRSLFATAVMALAMNLIDIASPVLQLVTAIAVGSVVYLAVALLVNLLKARELVAGFISRRLNTVTS